MASWAEWSFPPSVVVAGAVAMTFFVQGWLRLRRRRQSQAPWSRFALFALGLSIVLIGIVSPIDALGESYLQTFHMLQHVMLADLGIALMILALRGPLAVFFLPRDLLVPMARQRRLRAGLGWLLRPRNTLLAWIGLLAAWHVPVLYGAALGHRIVHDIQHVSFVFAGTILWIVLLDPMRHGRLSLPQRLTVGLVALLVGQVMSLILILSNQPFYGVYADQPIRILGLSPLTDQKIAGLVMMVEQLLTVGVFVCWCLRRGLVQSGSDFISRGASRGVTR